MVNNRTPEQEANFREWLAALRSGKFKQGTGKLAKKVSRGYQYCCLGVACELAARKGLVREVEIFYRAAKAYRKETDWAVPPHGLMEEVFGIDGSNPFVTYIHEEDETYMPECVYDNVIKELPGGRILVKTTKLISACNDSGMSFAEIADILEENYGAQES